MDVLQLVQLHQLQGQNVKLDAQVRSEAQLEEEERKDSRPVSGPRGLGRHPSMGFLTVDSFW